VFIVDAAAGIAGLNSDDGFVPRRGHRCRWLWAHPHRVTTRALTKGFLFVVCAVANDESAECRVRVVRYRPR
jgi:hypothetical protein